ncbi:hypothetical protein BP6252_10725 [Coleophoma cylindrospora]|uniref:Zn(2)-C6 fungal-type domain-containing protein n=1 Tax=Coleophoma cylindrospora TaxID=1849047 RepID=A0A3D8QU85_9HELO|nr:hypothetical protein BP6252_10725 [Coleophoma cylindrospora]
MDQQTSTSPGTAAPYGYACMDCARSKLKCIIGRAGGCERCRRLKKECRPSEATRRRRVRKPAAPKTTRLEEKLDSLVSLIKAGGMPNAPTNGQSDGGPSSRNGDLYRSPMLTPTDSPMASQQRSPSSGIDDAAVEISPVDAEEYLANFRTLNLKYFPFCYISPAAGAQQLRQERPFLWLCIMAVSSKSKPQQQLLTSKIRQTVAQEIVVNSEKNIDLLLGLLVFIGWAHCQLQSKPFLTVFTQLAMSVVFELGLNNPVPKDPQIMPYMKEKCRKPLSPRTIEERRAVLGCFLVSSIISSFLQKIDALRWTRHMDECLEMLEERKECLNDEILVEQVRLQLMVETMRPGILPHSALERTGHTGSQPSLYLHPLYSKLYEMKTNLLARHHTHEVVFLHLYSVELELVLPLTSLHTNQLMLQERENISAGIESIRSWFEVFFSIAPAAYGGLPFSILSQLYRCITVLHRLTTLDNPSWDRKDIWNEVDPLLILERAASNVEQAAHFAGLENNDNPKRDAFSQSAQMFRSLRPVWEAKLREGSLSSVSVAPNLNDSFAPDDFAFEFLDNDLLMELLISPNC